MKTKEEAFNKYREAMNFGYNINPTIEEIEGYNIMIELMENQISKNDYTGACFTGDKILQQKKSIIARQADQLDIFQQKSSLVQSAV